MLQPPFNNISLRFVTWLNPSSRLFRAVVELGFLKDIFKAFSKSTITINCYCFANMIKSIHFNFENISSLFFKISLLEQLCFALYCRGNILWKTCYNQIFTIKNGIWHQFYTNKPTFALFVFLPLEAAFHKFSTSLLITFGPIARFCCNFFQFVFNHKAYPPKMFLNLQIIAVVHHKPDNSKFWESGIRKMSWWGTLLENFQKLLWNLSYVTKNSFHAIAG